LTTIAHIYKKVFCIGMTRKLTRHFALLILLLPVGLWIVVASPLKNNFLKKLPPALNTARSPEPHKQTKIKKNGAFGGQIVTFSIPEELGPANIDQTHQFVGITVHATQDRSHLIPTITVTPGSTITPGSGVANDFTNAPLYTVDPGVGETNYNIQVLPAHTASACDGYNTTLAGDSPVASATYEWQVFTGGAWLPAPGANSGVDYITQVFNLGNISPVIYTYRRQITVGVFITYGSYYDVTVNPSTPISNYNIQQPPVSTFCGTGTPTINGDAPTGGLGPGTYVYQWRFSTDGTNFSDVATGGTGQNYTPATSLTQTTWFRRRVQSGPCALLQESNTVKITVEPQLGTNTIAATGTFCGSGDPGLITGNAVTGGDGTPVYKWESSPDNLTFTAIPGAAGTAFQNYDPPPITATTYYHRIVTSGSCSTGSISASVKFTIEPALSANTITSTGATTFCQTGDPTVINGLPITGGNGTPVYQWESSTDGTNFIPASGNANFQDYEPPVITTTTYYRRRVTSGSCSIPNYSTVLQYIIEQPIGNNTISANGPFCVSGTPVVTGSVPTGGDGVNYVYTWESSTDGGANFNPIPGATGQNYTPSSPITVTTSYRRTVSSGSCTPGTTSAAVTFTVTPAITANTIHTPITEFCISSGAFTITGDPPAGGNGTYTYQWQSSTDGVTYGNVSGTGTDISYNSPSITGTTWFKRVVSSGNCIGTSESAPVKITVYQAFAGNTLTPPAVNKFCGSGDAGQITGLVPTGGDGNPQYQWQQSADNVDAHFTNISGETGKDFDPPALTSTMFYRRIVAGPVCTIPDASPAVEIHITPPITPGTNQINPPLTTTFCTSVDPATIIGGLAQGGDPGAINYQWETSIDNGTTWVPVATNGNSPDYDPAPITRTTTYRRGVTSGACVTPVYSNTITLTIIPSPPNITIAPVAPVCSGSPAVLSVNSPDPALTYYWYDTRTRDHLLYTGPTFTTSPLTGNTTFFAEASNGVCQSPQMASVTVTVNALPDAPALDGAPYTDCRGSGVILKVLNPQAGLTYQWYTVATGGTAELTGAAVTTPVLNDNATYYVEAVNTATGCVSATRGVADIAVYPLPVAVAQGADICPGTKAVLTANSEDQDEQVIWYDAPAGGNQVGTGSTLVTPELTTNTSYYAEVINTISGCVSATRAEAKVRMILPLDAPIIQVQNNFAPTITFRWAPVSGATGYLVSTDNGATFSNPSSGSNGFTHSVGGLQVGQTVTLIVRSLGDLDCETSANSNPVTATAINPNTDEIFVANAFTPNGDGRNDIVYVHNENIKSLKFYVYSQYGQLLYASQSQQNGWDGTFKGKAEPAGVYVYYLEAVMNDGSLQNKRGTITLIR